MRRPVRRFVGGRRHHLGRRGRRQARLSRSTPPARSAPSALPRGTSWRSVALRLFPACAARRGRAKRSTRPRRRPARPTGESVTTGAGTSRRSLRRRAGPGASPAAGPARSRATVHLLSEGLIGDVVGAPAGRHPKPAPARPRSRAERRREFHRRRGLMRGVRSRSRRKLAPGAFLDGFRVTRVIETRPDVSTLVEAEGIGRPGRADSPRAGAHRRPRAPTRRPAPRPTPWIDPAPAPARSSRAPSKAEIVSTW